MVKIGILLPEENLLETTKKIAEEKQLEVVYLKVVQTENAVREARKAIDAGAHILVARGYQALRLKEALRIPVVEIRFTAQEIGLIIQKAKEKCRKEKPVIALVTIKNMLSDLSHLEELLGVKLLIRTMNHLGEVDAVLQAIGKYDPEIIIGGKATCEKAEMLGYQTIIYQATEESVREALTSAEHMALAIDSEKQNEAQFETILDSSFNGIIKVDKQARILAVNRHIENLIGRGEEDVEGCHLQEIMPSFELEPLFYVLEGKRDTYTTSIEIRGRAWMLTIAPIRYDERITGAILTLLQLEKERGNRKLKETLPDRNGEGMAWMTFRTMNSLDRNMTQLIERAKRYALSERPVLLYGGIGLSQQELAEAIHNNSSRKQKPFFVFDTDRMQPEKQIFALTGQEATTDEVLTGGILRRAKGGTLYIKKVNQLAMEAQSVLMEALLTSDIRLIASSCQNLAYGMQNGTFLPELYYTLSGLVLEIPELTRRPNDLKKAVEEQLKKYMERYNKHLKIADAVYGHICTLKWDGNQIQLEAFCEKLILDANRHTLDEAAVQHAYEELFPKVIGQEKEQRLVVYRSPESIELNELLEKYHGNRNLVAKELGISTTTLWRRMKKYGIEAKYDNE